eukprot:TRINITY_DN4273_c0_g1_i1.p2 TRINITY_DN4273_c0_g1~~TRINITY_DN4273_c0_g1_i1.p2  ORF type:complete len:245 (+),score=96.84 TRINITY_DN4273_c0_g1_i1:150-884(+)
MQRPDLHNAFNADVISELTDAFRTLPSDVRAVVLSGQGRSFSAGADLAWMRSMAEYSAEENKADSQKLFDMFYAIKTCPAPTIARVNGASLGGGAGLVACCDIALGVERAIFGFTEVKVGLIPAVISPFVLERVGITHGTRLFLTGERIDAKRAAHIGLLSEVVADDDALDARVDFVLGELLASSPAATRAAKQLVHELSTPTWRTHSDYVCSQIAQIRVSSEGQEGLQAFLGKRKPSWAVADK